MSESKKTVQIYFFSMDIERKKKGSDSTAYSMDAIILSLANLLATVVVKPEREKKHDIKSKKKIIWLDAVDNLQNGNFNLVIRSAKYDQSREVINTETMAPKGILKAPEDGDEEKTHLCIRFRDGSDRLIAICEYNNNGITANDIAAYLNEQFNLMHESTDEQYSYHASFQILPSADFLTELDKMTRRNLLRINMDISDSLKGDFWGIAGRDDIRSEVELRFKKKRRGKKFNISPELIRTLYQDTGATKIIKKITVEGSNESGSLTIDTESIQMKRSVSVDTCQPTNEINTKDFFNKIENLIDAEGVQACN